MTEIRKTDPNTGGMKGEKLEQYSLVDPGFRGYMVEAWEGGPRKDAALKMLEFEEGDDSRICDAVYACQDLIMDFAYLGDRGSATRREAVTALARQYGFGSRKYDRGNWRKGYAWSLSIDAFWRHLISAWSIDEESGNRHGVAALWHACCLRDFVSLGLGTDDRLYKRPEGQEVHPIEPVGPTLAGWSSAKKDMDLALTKLFSVPFIGSNFAPPGRIFIMGPGSDCSATIENLQACDGCEERACCEAEAGL